MKIRYSKNRRSIRASADYADLRGKDFKTARDILTKDGFHEHEYGDKDDNNGYAVYRKGDKEVELQYKWNKGKRKDEYHAGKVINVYVDDDINSACGKKSVKANRSSYGRRAVKAAMGRRAVNAATDISNLYIYVSSPCFVDVMVDDYNKGELDQVNSWEFDIADGFRTAQELLDDIAASSGIFTNNINDYVVLDDGSLQTDATVNVENDIPSESEIEAWKRGELELYNAHLWVKLKVGAKTHDMTMDEAESFGFPIY